MRDGARVVLCADALASISRFDRRIALEVRRKSRFTPQNLRHEGAQLGTAQSVVFAWLGSARHPAFAAVSKLVKALAATPLALADW